MDGAKVPPRTLALAVALGGAALLGILLLMPRARPDRTAAKNSPAAAPADGPPAPSHPPRSPAPPPSRKVARAKADALGSLIAALRRGDLASIRAANAALFAELVPLRPSEDSVSVPTYEATLLGMLQQPAPSEEYDAFNLLMTSGLEQLTTEQRELARRYVERHREAMALVHEAVRHPRRPLETDYTQGFAIVTEHPLPTQKALRLLKAEIALDPSAAGPKVAATARWLIDAAAEEPLIGTQLFRTWWLESSRGLMERSFESGIPEEMLGEMMGSLAPESAREAYRKAALFELHAVVRYMEAGMDLAALADLLKRVEGGERFLLGGHATAPPTRETVAAVARYAEMMEEFSRLLRVPYVQASPRLSELSRSLPLTLPHEVQGLALNFAAVSLRCADHEALLGTTQVAAAVQLFRARRGAYPASLAHLGPELPRDPFTGQSYAYRLEGNGFVVWSVGRDKIDQGATGLQDDVLFRVTR